MYTKSELALPNKGDLQVLWLRTDRNQLLAEGLEIQYTVSRQTQPWRTWNDTKGCYETTAFSHGHSEIAGNFSCKQLHNDGCWLEMDSEPTYKTKIVIIKTWPDPFTLIFNDVMILSHDVPIIKGSLITFVARSLIRLGEETNGDQYEKTCQ